VTLSGAGGLGGDSERRLDWSEFTVVVVRRAAHQRAGVRTVQFFRCLVMARCGRSRSCSVPLRSRTGEQLELALSLSPALTRSSRSGFVFWWGTHCGVRPLSWQRSISYLKAPLHFKRSSLPSTHRDLRLQDPATP
jgi:hypothetical protein